MTVFYGDDAFSILVLSTKKLYSSSLRKVFTFQKFCFKFKVLKLFKISTNCHITTCRSLKRRVIPSTVFLKNMLFLLELKFKTSKKKRFLVLRQKTNSKFAVELAERSNDLFLLYLMNHIFQTSVLFNTS